MPQPGSTKGVSPKWATLGRRYCDDCGKRYKLKRPLLENQRGFCSDKCRYAYHHHGGSYRKLKGEVTKMLEREMKAFHRQVDRAFRQAVLSTVNQTTGTWPEFLQVLRLEEAAAEKAQREE